MLRIGSTRLIGYSGAKLDDTATDPQRRRYAPAMMYRKILPLVFASLLLPLGAWANEDKTDSPSDEAAEVQRPVQPWVFRSVLDDRPRMVTVAMAEDLWLAYDASHCGLYKAWAGGVKFEGAVYTGRHGPQPESEGEAYQEIAGGGFWTLLDAEGADTQTPPRFRGYRLDGTRSMTMLYRFGGGEDEGVRVSETPSILADDDGDGDAGAVTLLRTFTVTGLPEGQTLRLLVGTDTQGGQFRTTGQARIVTEERGGGTVAFVEFYADGESTLVTRWDGTQEER